MLALQCLRPTRWAAPAVPPVETAAAELLEPKRLPVTVAVVVAVVVMQLLPEQVLVLGREQVTVLVQRMMGHHRWSPFQLHMLRLTCFQPCSPRVRSVVIW